jgi:hypothetical protein
MLGRHSPLDVAPSLFACILFSELPGPGDPSASASLVDVTTDRY